MLINVARSGEPADIVQAFAERGILVRDRSRDWEMRGGACAVRAADDEFAAVTHRHGALPNTARREDAHAPLITLRRSLSNPRLPTA